VSFDPDFDRLFAFGIDPVREVCPPTSRQDWPSVEKVLRYNARLRETLDKALSSITTADPRVESLGHGRLFDVAIEHRLMHVETLCYMLHQLPLERKLVRRVSPPPAARPHAPAKSTFPLESRRWGCRAHLRDNPGHSAGQ